MADYSSPAVADGSLQKRFAKLESVGPVAESRLWSFFVARTALLRTSANDRYLDVGGIRN
jgi:hypothetical protein